MKAGQTYKYLYMVHE